MAKAIEHFTFRSDAPLNASSEPLDLEIRNLVRLSKMPSPYIELDYQTEPSFFSALAAYGQQHDLVLIRPDGFAGLGGFGVRSTRRSYLGGEAADLGYLHHLRFHPAIRGGSFLARGYKVFREIFNNQPLPVTLTSILEDNLPARELLESNRAGGVMPKYQAVSRFLTALIPLRGPGKRWPQKYRDSQKSSYQVRKLCGTDLSQAIALFDEAGRHNDGAPQFGSASLDSMLGIFSGDELLAAIGIWNQQQYRQIVLSHLCSPLLNVRNIWQAGRQIWGSCPVPGIGEQVNSVLLDPWAIKPGFETRLMPLLLKAAIKEAQLSGALFAAFGIAEKNPAINAVKTVFFLPYWSIIYQVFWPETGSYEFGKRQMQLSNLGAL